MHDPSSNSTRAAPPLLSCPPFDDDDDTIQSDDFDPTFASSDPFDDLRHDSAAPADDPDDFHFLRDEPARLQHTSSGEDDTLIYGISEMQGWRISE